MYGIMYLTHHDGRCHCLSPVSSSDARKQLVEQERWRNTGHMCIFQLRTSLFVFPYQYVPPFTTGGLFSDRSSVPIPNLVQRDGWRWMLTWGAWINGSHASVWKRCYVIGEAAEAHVTLRL